jgi:hypothetical protein
VLNFTLAAAETWANGWIKAINLIIRGLNLVNPFSDIPYIPEVNLPRIGGGGGGGGPTLAAIRAEREGNLPPTAGGGFNMPNIIPPAGAGGGGGGAGGAGRTIARTLAPAMGTTLGSTAITDPFAWITPGDNPRARRDAGIVVNINGGLATSAEIGEAVVNSIRSYNQVQGPANIAVA